MHAHGAAAPRLTAVKKRLDARLVELGLAESRARAQAYIRAGLVHTTDKRLDKPGLAVDDALPLFVKAPDHAYVSRGGVKLAGALNAFAIDPRGWTCLDVGASTGGFTDCLLQRGAERVCAMDVGRGQLHARVAADSRVTSVEKLHVDDLQPATFGVAFDLAVADLSFISARRALAPLLRVLKPGGQLLLLVKPQFEAGRAEASRGSGVIRDEAVQLAAVDAVERAAREAGYEALGRAPSPIEGGDGNREFFLHLRRP